MSGPAHSNEICRRRLSPAMNRQLQRQGVNIMPISPIGSGDGRPQTWTFTTDTSIFPLTGIANGSIAMHLEDINNNNALYICTGAWNVTNAGSVGPPIVLP